MELHYLSKSRATSPSLRVRLSWRIFARVRGGAGPGGGLGERPLGRSVSGPPGPGSLQVHMGVGAVGADNASWPALGGGAGRISGFCAPLTIPPARAAGLRLGGHAPRWCGAWSAPWGSCAPPSWWFEAPPPWWPWGSSGGGVGLPGLGGGGEGGSVVPASGSFGGECFFCGCGSRCHLWCFWG